MVELWWINPIFINMKICVICKIEKPLSDFHKYKQSKDGHRYSCKECRKIEKKNYYIENYDKISNYNKEYWLNNKNKIVPRVDRWRKDNKEKVREYQKKYVLKNQEKIKEYRRKNKHLSNLRVKKYENNNITASIARRLVRRTLKFSLENKNNKRSFEILGYTPHQLKQRIECQFKDGMSWDNYGQWHVDHKKPITLFEKPTPVRIINSLCNLQPLWALDNLKKNNKRIG